MITTQSRFEALKGNDDVWVYIITFFLMYISNMVTHIQKLSLCMCSTLTKLRYNPDVWSEDSYNITQKGPQGKEIGKMTKWENDQNDWTDIPLLISNVLLWD